MNPTKRLIWRTISLFLALFLCLGLLPGMNAARAYAEEPDGACAQESTVMTTDSITQESGPSSEGEQDATEKNENTYTDGDTESEKAEDADSRNADTEKEETGESKAIPVEDRVPPELVLGISLEDEELTAYIDFFQLEMDLNSAAVAGILANMERESGFNCEILGDNGTSYGLCQWRGSRQKYLDEFCEENGLKKDARDTQLAFTKWELEEYYADTLNLLKECSDTEQGAIRAARFFCLYYEVPMDMELELYLRGKLAAEHFYPRLAALENAEELGEDEPLSKDPAETTPDEEEPGTRTDTRGDDAVEIRGDGGTTDAGSIKVEEEVSVNALGNSAQITSGYLENYFSSAGSGVVTPSHYIVSPETVAYCLQEQRLSPAGQTYVQYPSPENVGINQTVLDGIQRILEHGYPAVTPPGLTDEQARYATANAIRTWEAIQGVNNVSDYFANPSTLYPTDSSYRETYNFYLLLVDYAINGSELTHSIAFSPTTLELTLNSDGTFFEGTASLTLTNCNSGFTLSHSLPSGSVVTKDIANNKVTIKIPANSSTAGKTYTMTATGMDNRSASNLTLWKDWAHPKLQCMVAYEVTITEVTDPASLNVKTPTMGFPLSLTKTSADPSVTDGNSCYSLEGAVYVIYSNPACTGELERITTDAEGKAITTGNYGPGKYFAKEIRPSKGFLLDERIHTLTLGSNGAVTVDLPFTERPTDDPDYVRIKKSSNGASFPITSSSAVFKVEFFPNDSWRGSPSRTWYYKTIDGECWLGMEKYLDTSKTNSALWFTSTGSVTFPLGTLRISEESAPAGYIKTNTVLNAKVTQDSVGAYGTWHWVTAESGVIHYEADGLNLDNAPAPGQIDVCKKTTGGTPVSGSQFLLEYSTNKGGSWSPVFAPTAAGDVYPGTCTSSGLSAGVLTTGADGHAVFTGLIADNSTLYRITEIHAPNGKTLLAEPFVVGTLPLPTGETGPIRDVTVTDGTAFRLPLTGGNGFAVQPIVLGLSALVAAWVIIRRWRKNNRVFQH